MSGCPLHAPVLSSALALFLVTAGVGAAEYRVTTSAGWASLPATLVAGDRVVVAPGTYADVSRTIRFAATRENPVVITAEVPGASRFAGSTQLVFTGRGGVFEGFVFDGREAAGGPRFESGILRLDTGSEDIVLRELRFRDFDTGAPATGAFWVRVGGYRHVVEYCSFEGKVSEKPVLNIVPPEDESAPAGTFPTRDIPRHHLVRYCYFGERRLIGPNGWETIRVGESGSQMVAMATRVEHCLFERAIYGDDVTGHEPEVISSKSRLNHYRGNTFLHNKGGLVLRHGDDNLVEDNVFIGEPGSVMGAGVRVIGLRHVVRNNHFESIDGTGLRAALAVMKGSGEWPELSILNTYETASFARIFHNTFVDCRQPLLLGATTSSSGTTAPRGVEVRGNVVVSSADDGVALTHVDADGFAIGSVAFSGNLVQHAAGLVANVAPASGWSAAAVGLARDPATGLFAPGPGSPALASVAATLPPTLRDGLGRLRAEGPATAGAIDPGATGQARFRVLARADVGPAYDGRANAVPAPSLVAWPRDVAARVGAPLALEVVARGTGPFAYGWAKDEVAIPGADGPVLDLGPLASGDAGSYVASVTGPGGRVETFPARVAVLESRPVITEGPASVVAAAGDAFALRAAGDGEPPLAWRWLRDGVVVPGATGATLAWTSVPAEAAGTWVAELSNAAGTARSGPAELYLSTAAMPLRERFADGEAATQARPHSARWFPSSGSFAVGSGGGVEVAAGRHALAYVREDLAADLPVGHRLAATWTVRFATVGNASGGFRVGWFHAGSTARPTGATNTFFSAYDGYAATFTAALPDSNGATTAPIVFRRRVPGSGTSLVSTVGSGIFATLATGPSLARSLPAGVDVRLVLAMTRESAGSLRLSLDVFPGAEEPFGWAWTDTAAPLLRFDSLAILSTSTNGSTFTVRSVVVEEGPVGAAPEGERRWREAWFGRAEAAGVAAHGADPDGDGVPNRLEFLFGTAPGRPGERAGLALDLASPGGPSLRFPLAPEAAGVPWRLERGAAPGAWMPAGSPAAVDGFVVVPLGLPGDGSTFWRLVVD